MYKGSSINKVELNCQQCGKTFDSSEAVCEGCHNEVSKEMAVLDAHIEKLEEQIEKREEEYETLRQLVCNCPQCSSKIVIENL